MRKSLFTKLISIAFVSYLASSCSLIASHSHSSDIVTPTVISYESSPDSFNTKTFAIHHAGRTFFVDSQFTQTEAKNFYRKVEKEIESEIEGGVVFVTHANPDKFNGAQSLKATNEKLKLLTSKNTANEIPKVHDYKKYYFTQIAKSFSETDYPKISEIETHFEDRLEYDLAGIKIDLIEIKTAALAETHNVVYVESANALFVGDLIHYKAHAWLEGPVATGKSEFNVKNWLKVLDRLEELFPAETKVYAGRGEVAELAVTLQAQRAYLLKAKDIVDEYVARKELSKQNLTREKISQASQDLRAMFEAAFPDYDVSYMIEYGIYGMLQSSLE